MAPTWLKAPIYGAEPFRGTAAILTNYFLNVPRMRSAFLQNCKVLPNRALPTDSEPHPVERTPRPDDSGRNAAFLIERDERKGEAV